MISDTTPNLECKIVRLLEACWRYNSVSSVELMSVPIRVFPKAICSLVELIRDMRFGGRRMTFFGLANTLLDDSHALLIVGARRSQMILKEYTVLCLCVQIIFARRSATLNDLLARTVNHDLFSPVLELGELCLQAPQSSLLLPNDGLPALIFLDLLIQNGHRLRAILDWEGYINFCVRKVGTDGKASTGNSIT